MAWRGAQGPVTGSVIGTHMPRFSFFGDTVNVASRMESHGFPMCIHLSETVVGQAVADGECRSAFMLYGEREIKGKGFMKTYLAKVRLHCCTVL